MDKKACLVRIRKFLKKQGIDDDKVDVESIYDSSLTYDENLNNLCEKLQINTQSLKEKVVEQLLNEKKVNEEFVEKVSKEQEEAISNIKQGSPELERFFKIPINLIEMVAKGVTHAVFFEGGGGFGKTTIVTKTLTRLGLKLNEDFIIIKGYASPFEFYKKMYDNCNKKVIFLDDTEGIMSNKITKSMLKSGLDNAFGGRYIEYIGKESNVPTKFKLNAGLIICGNSFPKDTDWLAVKDRVFYHKLSWGREDILNMMSEIIKEDVEGITFDERLEILRFLNETIKPYHDNVSLRTLRKAFDLFKFNKGEWKSMVDETIGLNPVKKLVFDLENREIMVKDMYVEFRKETGLSYTTFLEYRHDLGLKRYNYRGG